jgi:1-acyl-sn-glycerol-3-phosphate acyltransferase
MISFLRTILTIVTAFIVTLFLGGAVVIAGLFGLKDDPGGLFDNAPRWWSKTILWAAGVKVRVHGIENGSRPEPHIFASNHVSWFDVAALASVLPRYKFVAKAELFKVPVFGRAMRAAGMIEIQRENRKAAFGAYEIAADRIREGNSVVVFPEGTRGRAYPLRPFKKGPFVLAIAAGVPIVPVIVHGTIES